MKEPVFKAILKYKSHPIILVIRDTGKKVSCFKDVTIAKIEKEIKKLGNKTPLIMVIFQQELLKRMQIFLQTFCVKVLTLLLNHQYFQFFETG